VARVTGLLILLSGSSVLRTVGLVRLAWGVRLDPHAQRRARVGATLHRQCEHD